MDNTLAVSKILPGFDPEGKFTSTEMSVIASHICDPLVQKYLIHLARMSMKALAHSQRLSGESAESYLERRAAVTGGLAAIETLLTIEPATTAASS